MRFIPRWLAAAVAVVCLCLPPALAGQVNGGLDQTPPTISISPGTNNASVDSVRVYVYWNDNVGVDSSRRTIEFNGVEVRTSFTYTGSATSAVSTGVVKLKNGTNVVRALIADLQGNVGQPAQVTYTYNAPAIPPPTTTSPTAPTTQSGSSYTVSVTPDGGDTLWITTGGYYVAANFTVANTGTGAAWYLATGACTNVAAGACAATRDTVALAGGESRQVGVLVPVSYTVGAAGTVRLRVAMVGNTAVADSGWVPAKVVTPGSLAPSGRTMLERDECPVVSLGGGGAAECGDLRLVAGLPATRTLNRAWSPALLYNSQHAYPSSVVGTLVANGTGASWDSVSAVVRRAGTVVASGRWPGWTDAAGHRISLAFAETGLPSYAPSATVYNDTIVVSVKTAGAWAQQSVVPVSHVVVDRRGSPFGSGWWLAGLERIHFLSTQLLWLGGDGSARIYAPVGINRWVSAEPEHPDTIVAKQVTLFNGATETGYVRTLPGKVEVAYRGTGLQLYTRNRLGQTTWFFYNDPNANDRLTQVAMPTPVAGDTSRSYWFKYNSAAGTLGEVVAPYVTTSGDRRTVVSASGSTGAVRVSAITSLAGTADSMRVQYGYDAQGRDTLVIAPGTLTPTRFQYNAAASRVVRGMTIAQTNGHTDTVTVGITPQELRGLPAANGSAAAPSSSFYTQVDGPLPGTGDYVLYYQDDAGRVTTVSTPQGSTLIYRTDARYPGLVTRTKAPNNHTVFASFDSRGRLATQTDVDPLGDGRNATTLYGWNDSWDEIASVTSPTGITTTYGYNASGLREWQQVGADSTRRTRYTFNPQGQVTQVRSVSAAMRGEQAEVMAYSSTTGNLVSTTSPLGIQTLSYSDRIGRDTLVVGQQDTLRTNTGNNGLLLSYSTSTYDLAGRVRETLSWGQQQGYFSKMDDSWRQSRFMRLRTNSYYDAAGRLVRVDRRSDQDSAQVGVITTRFEYDGFGRKTAEIAPDSMIDRHHYDLGGRDTLWVNRRGEAIKSTYDLLGHVLTRTMPADVSGPIVVPGDTSTFTYDAQTGAMLSADNASARIRRSYYPNGLLKGDTSWVAFANRTFVTGRHRYGIRYDYDLEGRRTALTLPDSVRPSATQTQLRYAYDAVTGALSRIIDPIGYPYTFHYRTDGALDTLWLPGNAMETRAYDADGRLRVRTRAAEAISYRDSLWYDLRGKATEVHTRQGQYHITYDGLGQLVHSFTNEWTSFNVPESEEEYFRDALGNEVWHRRTSYAMKVVNPGNVYPTVQYYAPNTGRNTATVAAPGIYKEDMAPARQSITRVFDSAGNLRQMSEANPVSLLAGAMMVGGGARPRTDYAEPDGVNDGAATSKDGEQQIFTTYSYRPDGKLVLIIRQPTCIYSHGANGGCTSQAPAYNDQGRGESFRYDALGRRVWATTNTTIEANQQSPSGGCWFRCDQTTRRTIWDGDQVLAEIRYPNAQGEQDSGLDSTNVAEKAYRDANPTTAAGNPFGGRNTSDWAQSGRIVYVHGGGMDQPLGMLRMDYSYDFPDAVGIIPHASWRGTYEIASFTTPDCKQVFLPYAGMVFQDSLGRLAFPASVTNEQGIEQDTTQQRCVEIDFPGKYQGMSRLLRRQTASGPIAWMGSLVQDGQEASGLMFRRNRFYDPASGRFTQEDPIGLAGGMNAYAFAEGDPVNYSDPYGLSADTLRPIGKMREVIGQCSAVRACASILNAGQNAPGLFKMVYGTCSGGNGGCTTHRAGDQRHGTITIDKLSLPAAAEFYGVGKVTVVETVGHEVAHANSWMNGRECSEPCARSRQDLIRQDLHLPDIDVHRRRPENEGTNP